MKRVFLTAFLSTALLLNGCAADNKDQALHGDTGKTDLIEQIAQQQAQAEETTEEDGLPEAVVTAPDAALKDPAMQTGDFDLEPLPESDVDVDLTKMSSTMVYARVLNLLTHPETYLGMTVRMQGKFSLYVDPETDAHYFACIIPDATACCAQGIEFVRKGSPSYPEDYPELEEEVVVSGIFEIYEENGLRYVRLGDADMQTLSAQAAPNG